MGICLQAALLIDGFLAEAIEESSFGINFDILETNLINLAIVIGILFYFGRKLLGNILGERRSRLETAIREAEQRKQEAMSALAEQQQKLAQAQAEAKRILETAEKNAETARAEVLAQSEKDLERLRASAAQDLTSQQERIVSELRRQVAALALDKVESQLSDHLDDSVQQQLISHSIGRLGGM